MRLLLMCLFIFEFTHVATGCFCFPTHLQQHFCKSQFVIYAFPFQKLKTSTSGGLNTYRVLVLEVLKDISGKITKWSINTLATTSSSCGIGVPLFTRNLYGGKLEKGGFRVDECNLHLRWTGLTECEKALLGGTYGPNKRGYDCSCEVQYNCTPGAKCPPDPNRKCLWRPSSTSDTYCQRTRCKSDDVCVLRKCEK